MIIKTATVVWGHSYIEDFFNLSLKFFQFYFKILKIFKISKILKN